MLTDQLVAAWLFNGTVVDAIGGRSLSNGGTPQYASGKIGQSLVLSQYGVPFTAELPTPNGSAISMALWMKIGLGVETDEELFEIRSKGSTTKYFRSQPSANANNQAIARNGTTTKYTPAITGFNVTDWNLLVAVTTPGANVKFSLNGGAFQQTVGAPATWTDPSLISLPKYELQEIGYLDSAYVWHRELLQADVDGLWVNGAGSEYPFSAATLKQHLVVDPTGLIQPVGACVVVPGWI